MYDSIYRTTLEKMVTRRLKVMPLPKKEEVDVGKSEPGGAGDTDRADIHPDTQSGEGDVDRSSVAVCDDQSSRTEYNPSEHGS
jgi:hypothetical protein